MKKKTPEERITAKEFGIKIAKVMNELKSSHVYFIVQQAFGEIEWNSVQDILDNVIKQEKKSTR